MKASVLIIHSRYLSGAASGENRAVEDEPQLLSEGGHHVDTWTSQYEETGAILPRSDRGGGDEMKRPVRLKAAIWRRVCPL